MVNLSYLLLLTSSEKTYTVSYRYDEEAINQSASLSKLNRLFHISNILGDDAAYAVYGTFCIPINAHILSILEKEDLALKTQYGLNAIERYLSSSAEYDKKLLISLMDDLLANCHMEESFLGLYVYLSLLHTLFKLHVLSKRDIKPLFKRNVMERKVLSTLFYSIRFVPADGIDLLLSIISQEILECICFFPVKEKMYILHCLVSFANRRFPPYPYQEQSISLNKYITNILSYFYKIVQTIPEEYKISEIGPICYEFLREIFHGYESLISWDGFAAILQLSLALERAGNEEMGEEILYLCTSRMDMYYFIKNFPQNKELSSSLYSTLIDCYYYITQRHDVRLHENGKLKQILLEFFQRAGFRLLLPAYEKSFYYLLCLFSNDSIMPIYDLRSDVYQIIKQYGKHLSVYTLRKIKEYGEFVHDKAICREVELLVKI